MRKPDEGLGTRVLGGGTRSSLALVFVLVLGCRSDVLRPPLPAERVAPAIVHELASEIGPRPTGTIACARAANAIERRLKALGLANVHHERFEVAETWENAEADVRVERRAIRALPMSRSGTTETVEGPIAPVSLGAAFDAAAMKGSVAFLSPPYPKSYGTWKKALRDVAASLHGAGALGLVMALGHGEAKVISITADGTSEPLPAIVVGEDDGLILRGMTGARMRLRVSATRGARSTASNVIGEIQGREPEIVLAHAHLDTVYGSPGARDDAAGAAILIEAAQILLTMPQPRRTIRFVFFSGEEDGMLGSRVYVAQHDAELDQIAAVLAIDSGAERIIGLDANERVDTKAALDRFAAGLGLRVENSASPMNIDNGFFAIAGVPTLSVVQDTMAYMANYHHRAADAAEGIDPAALHSLFLSLTIR